MKKNKMVTGFFLIITLFLFGAIIYVSIVLNNTTEKAATTVKKTKASSQTYHKLLAVNIPIDPVDYSTPTREPTPTPTQTPLLSPTPEPTTIPTRIPSPTSQASDNIQKEAGSGGVNPNTDSIIPTQKISAQSSSLSSSVSSTDQFSSQSQSGISSSSSSSQSPLLAYKTQSQASPTLLPAQETGGQNVSSQKPISSTITQQSSEMPVTQIPTRVETLPNSGWIQTSTLLFIVAATTILFSLLF